MIYRYIATKIINSLVVMICMEDLAYYYCYSRYAHEAGIRSVASIKTNLGMRLFNLDASQAVQKGWHFGDYFISCCLRFHGSSVMKRYGIWG